MRRRLLQLLASLSLLLALATAGLWIRSAWRIDVILHRRDVRTASDGWSGTSAITNLSSRAGRIGFQKKSAEFEGVYNPRAGEFKDADRWKFSSDPVATGGLSDSRSFIAEATSSGWRAEGAARQGGPGRSRDFSARVQIPHWFLVFLFSLLPAVRVIRWQLRRRRARELGPDARPCPSCGYDRRATPTRCPECGHATHETAGDEASTDEPSADEPPSDQAPSDEAMGRPQEAGR